MTNREIVEELLRLVFDANDLDSAGALLHPDFVSHNPLVPHDPATQSGRDAFLDFFRGPAGRALMAADSEVRRIVAGDDLVAVHSRLAMAGAPPTAIVDILRVLDGKIVEHWDVVQPIPDVPANPHEMV